MRVVFNALILVVVTTLGSVASALAWPLSPGGRLGALTTRHWSRALLGLSGVRLDVRGRSGVGAGPCLIVANHASMLDIMVCAAAIPLRFHFASRPFFFKIPILGWGMRAARHVSLDPKRPRQAARVLRGLGKRFGRGLSVALFPEGTRSPDGRVGAYKRGPFLTAIQNGVPVLPVRLHDTQELFPKGSFSLRPGVIRVVFGAPIPTRDLKPPDARDLARRVEDWTRNA